jgi:hypothetical protein
VATLVLTVTHRGKSVPYPSQNRERSVNHGFKSLKGVENGSTHVPEAADDPALQFAINRINARETAFFTLGCEKSFNRDHSGFWARGYIEFAFNYVSMVKDAKIDSTYRSITIGNWKVPPFRTRTAPAGPWRHGLRPRVSLRRFKLATVGTLDWSS